MAILNVDENELELPDNSSILLSAEELGIPYSSAVLFLSTL